MRKSMNRDKLWGGFVDDKLDILDVDTGWGGFGNGDGMRKMPAIFTSKKDARKCYEDVRQVLARPIKRVGASQ